LRRFKEFFDGAQSWSRVERIIARVEAGAEGPDTRFVVTNLSKRNARGRRHGKRAYRDRVCGAWRHGADGRGRNGRGHAVRRHDSRLNRDAHQLQRFAERSVDHDQRRGSPFPFHRHAAIAAFVFQVARRRLSFARGSCHGFLDI
ncbi:MAG TPA: transposase, partial [Roseiarcus sp.]|nr:transposase [Roseiarcus sp.]